MRREGRGPRGEGRVGEVEDKGVDDLDFIVQKINIKCLSSSDLAKSKQVNKEASSIQSLTV